MISFVFDLSKCNKYNLEHELSHNEMCEMFYGSNQYDIVYFFCRNGQTRITTVIQTYIHTYLYIANG